MDKFLAFTKEWIFSQHTGFGEALDNTLLEPTRYGLTQKQAIKNMPDKSNWNGVLKDLDADLAVKIHENVYWATTDIGLVFAFSPICASVLTKCLVICGKNVVAKIIDKASNSLCMVYGDGVAKVSAKEALQRVSKRHTTRHEDAQFYKLILAGIIAEVGTDRSMGTYVNGLLDALDKHEQNYTAFLSAKRTAHTAS